MAEAPLTSMASLARARSRSSRPGCLRFRERWYVRLCTPGLWHGGKLTASAAAVLAAGACRRRVRMEPVPWGRVRGSGYLGVLKNRTSSKRGWGW